LSFVKKYDRHLIRFYKPQNNISKFIKNFKENHRDIGCEGYMNKIEKYLEISVIKKNKRYFHEL